MMFEWPWRENRKSHKKIKDRFGLGAKNSIRLEGLARFFEIWLVLKIWKNRFVTLEKNRSFHLLIDSEQDLQPFKNASHWKQT